MSTATDLDRVPVGPLQEAFRRTGRPLNQVAEDLGWLVGASGDGRRLARALGLAPYQGGRRGSGVRPWITRETIPYDQAVRIARAMGVDPMDVGV